MFKINKKTNYGLEFMAVLGRRFGQGPVSISELAQDKNISRRFLERIASQLRKAGLVESKEGRGGGYFLKKSPDKISLGKIVRVLEGPMKMGRCSPCEMKEVCSQKKVWREIREKMRGFLEQKTIEDLI